MKIKQLTNIGVNTNILALYENVADVKIEIYNTSDTDPVIMKTNNSEGSIILYGNKNYIIKHNITNLVFTKIPTTAALRISFTHGENLNEENS